MFNFYEYLDGETAELTTIEELEPKVAPDQSSAGFLD
jgi:hypothetical protein